MGPIFHKLEKDYKGKSVQFVLLDFTDKKTTKAAERKGTELGIKNIYDIHKGTGVIILLDGKNLEEITRLTPGQTEKQMREKIEKALKM